MVSLSGSPLGMGLTSFASGGLVDCNGIQRPSYCAWIASCTLRNHRCLMIISKSPAYCRSAKFALAHSNLAFSKQLSYRHNLLLDAMLHLLPYISMVLSIRFAT